jgi:hypothetical protein
MFVNAAMDEDGNSLPMSCVDCFSASLVVVMSAPVMCCVCTM